MSKRTREDRGPGQSQKRSPIPVLQHIKNCNCFIVAAAEADIRPLLKKPQCPGSVWLSIAKFRPLLKATGGLH